MGGGGGGEGGVYEKGMWGEQWGGEYVVLEHEKTEWCVAGVV